MGLKAVWGFDPEEAIKAQQAFHQRLSGTMSAPDGEPDVHTNVPSSAIAQVHELERLFRL